MPSGGVLAFTVTWEASGVPPEKKAGKKKSARAKGSEDEGSDEGSVRPRAEAALSTGSTPLPSPMKNVTQTL